MEWFQDFISSYTTQRRVRVPSPLLKILWLICGFGVFCFIFFYQLWHNEGAFDKSNIRPVFTTKVKGAFGTQDIPEDDWNIPRESRSVYKRNWDAVDVVLQARGDDSGGFIISTNLIITPNQQMGTCAELRSNGYIKCTRDGDCLPRKGKTLYKGSGQITGKCKTTEGTCEVNAWCPIQGHRLPLKNNKALLLGTKNFTVLLKNTIHFTAFGEEYTRRNIMNEFNVTYDALSHCIHDREKDPLCPIFRIGDIVSWSSVPGTEFKYEKVAKTGGVFAIRVEWRCYFGKTEDCKPKYSFARLDKAYGEGTDVVGFNVMSAYQHEKERRTLVKTYGIKIVIEAHGEGSMIGKTKIIFTVGAGFGLFALVTWVCERLIDILFLLKRNTDCCRHRCFGKVRNYLKEYHEEMVYYGIRNVKNVETQVRLSEDNHLLKVVEEPSSGDP